MMFTNLLKLQGTFSSSLGVLLSMLGSVVGTGNIWRYPRIVANNAAEGGKSTHALFMTSHVSVWNSLKNP